MLSYNILQIPQVTYNESKDALLLRYFTSSSAIEYSIPRKELRNRDPKTGHMINTLNYIPNNYKPVQFEYKGNYGVAIIWDDAYYTDIFPYEILKNIANEFKK